MNEDQVHCAQPVGQRKTGANVTGTVANRRIFRVECAGLDDGRYGTNFDDLMVFSLPRICNISCNKTCFLSLVLSTTLKCDTLCQQENLRYFIRGVHNFLRRGSASAVRATCLSLTQTTMTLSVPSSQRCVCIRDPRLMMWPPNSGLSGPQFKRTDVGREGRLYLSLVLTSAAREGLT